MTALLFTALADNLRLGRIPHADLHVHTSWTDGADDVAAMYGEAVSRGVETMLFSEHARRTSGDWFLEFAAQVRALPPTPCRALVGVEAKIDDLDGRLDSSPEILSACDLVMASVHRFPGESGSIKGTTGGYTAEQAVEMEFQLSLAAMDNPAVHILGHPFAMSIKRFGAALPWNLVERLVTKAAETGVAFEINARYHPDPWRLIRACLEAGAPLSLGSNAHARDEVGLITHILEGSHAK